MRSSNAGLENSPANLTDFLDCPEKELCDRENAETLTTQNELLDCIAKVAKAKTCSEKNEEELVARRAVLESLSKAQLLKLAERVTAGENVTNVLADVAESLRLQIQEATDDQYRTLEATEDKTEREDDDESFDDEEVMDEEASITHLLNLKQLDTFDDNYYKGVARFTPLRLRYEERFFLRLLEGTMDISEYTDRIDVFTRSSRAHKIAREIRQVCAILSGLVISHDYEIGQRLLKDRNYAANMNFYRLVFEIGRRYKILNPEVMRSSYGKLLYLLMDARRPDVQELLEFDCVSRVSTVYSYLATKKHGMTLLKDPLLRIATSEIHSEGKQRGEVERAIKDKNNAVKKLAQKYAIRKPEQKQGMLSSALRMIFSRSTVNMQPVSEGSEDDDLNECGMSPDDVEHCIYSLADHATHLRFNSDPCQVMKDYLETYFFPTHAEQEFSLGIEAGRQGSRLTHSHSRQYKFVLQSLSLWKQIGRDMFILWHLAEADMLNPDNRYILADTGQGLNRIQRAPNVLERMRSILGRVQKELGGWVGSAAIHLGDRDVPNAFIFIDKYTQVPRILNPIVTCLRKIPDLYGPRSSIRNFIQHLYPSPDLAIKNILADFFRHGFDGSGADNFMDAGSCIDGRLTSAWNWCSNIEKKRYFPLFQLTGFNGFDGTF